MSVHSVTGMPWALTIPLLAFSVNLLFRLPFTIHSQVLAQRRAKVAPVIQGWRMKLLRVAVKEKTPAQDLQEGVKKRTEKEAKRIFKALGLQQWKSYLALLGVPFWLATLAGVRRLCGLGGGLPPGTTGAKLGNGSELDVSSKLPPSSTSSAQHITTISSDSVTISVEDPVAAIDAFSETPALNSHLTLATEGTLWFPDLTTADPYYILPLCFTLLTVANVFPQDKNLRRSLFPRIDALLARLQGQDSGGRSQTDPVTNPAADQGKPRVAQQLTKALVYASPMVFLVTSSFPAAMHLYAITSAASTLGARLILSRMKVVDQRIKVSQHRELAVVRPKIIPKDGREARN